MKKLFTALLMMLFIIFIAIFVPVSVNASSKSFSYNCVDGTSVSCYSEDVINTVLIFGRPNCPNTGGTLRNIASSNLIFRNDVRFVFIDVDGNTVQTVSDFADTINCNSIKFCYDTGKSASNDQWYYLKESGNNTNSVILPVVAYISNRNTLNYVTTGIRSVQDMISDINIAYSSYQSFGLNVDEHSISDINNKFASLSPDLSLENTYAKQPVNTPPYDKGEISSTTLKNGINTLNFIRYVAGIDYDVSILNSYQEYAQAASAVNRANGMISHYPSKPNDMEDTLYEQGAYGARRSNLASGYRNLARAIANGWMADEDDSNIDRVGHRRWCLNPSMKYTGFGVNASFYSMYAFDTSGSNNHSGVAWPAQNMPIEYFKDYSGRSSTMPWSISMGKYVDTSSVNVTLTRASDGRVWNFSSSSSNGDFYVNNGGYGQTGCIIFRPSDITYSSDDSFFVEIKGNNLDVSYSVSFFEIDHEHIGGTATCSKKAKCSLCGEEYGDYDSTVHSGITTYSGYGSNGIYNYNYEYKKCFYCGTSIANKVYYGSFGADGSNLSWSLDIDSGKLTVSGSGKMEDFYVTSSEYGMIVRPPWVSFSDSVTEVVVSDGITNISSGAFRNLNNLEKLTIGSNVTDIGKYAFENCYSIKEVVIPRSVKSIGSYAFSNCSELDKVTFESIDCIINDKYDDVFSNEIMTTGGVFYGKFYCYKNSTALTYAKSKRFAYFVIDCDHSLTSLKNQKSSTCTENGYTGDTYCSICESLMKTGSIIYASHNIVVDKAYKETCTADGKTEGSHCSVCGKVIVSQTIIPATGHKYICLKSVLSSCEEDGLKTYKCQLCSDSYTEVIPAIGHKYKLDVTEATCTKGGYTTYTCTNPGCTDSYIGDFTAKTSHKFTVIIEKFEATCKYDGKIVRKCATCDLTETEVIKATGEHVYIEKTTTDPTCLNTGIKAFTCGCGQNYTESIPALGHDWKITSKTDASCEIKGSIQYNCSRCNTVKSEIIAELSHKYVSVGYTVIPTCTEPGTEKFICKNCNNSYNKTVAPIGHKVIVLEAVEATCTTDGLTEGSHCSACNQIIIEQTVIKAKGHDFCNWSFLVEQTCKTEGIKTRQCSVCKKIETVYVAKLSHTPEIIKGRAPVCSNSGLTDGKKCAVCGKVILAQKQIPPTGHKTIIVNKLNATYFEYGCKGDTRCAICNVMLKKGALIPKLKLSIPKIKVVAGKRLFKVKYYKVSGATGFQICYKIGNRKYYKNFKSKNSVTKTIKNLKKGKKCVIKIRAFVKSGYKVAYSSWSSAKSVKVK